MTSAYEESNTRSWLASQLPCVLFYKVSYFKDSVFNFVYMYASVVGKLSACGGQKKVLDILELKLQAVISHQMLVLGTRLESSLQEQSIFLPAESSFQPLSSAF